MNLQEIMRLARAQENQYGGSKQVVKKSRFLSVSEMKNLPPLEWLIDGVLPRKGLAALYGASGSGKSFLALDIAVHIAAGLPTWFGHPLHRCPVTYVCLEGAGGMNNRVKVFNLSDEVLAPLNFSKEPFNLLGEYAVSNLAEDICAVGADNGLIIIDTLNQATPGIDENSGKDMGAIISSAMHLQKMTGGLVLLVHHTGKDPRQGMRGHSSLLAALDAAIEVTHSRSGRTWRMAKAKDGEAGQHFSFRLEKVKVMEDEQGNDVTSCTVVMTDATSPRKDSPSKGSLSKLPSGANQKLAKKILDNLLENSSECGEGGAPEGRSCILLDDAVSYVAQSVQSEDKRKKERAKKAILALVDHGFYASANGWLWQE